MRPIGKNIKEQRNRVGMTQEQLATQLHVTRQAVSSWENGKTRPDLETVKAIADIFAISVEELIYGHPVLKDAPPAETVGVGLYVGGLLLFWVTMFCLVGFWWLYLSGIITLVGLVVVAIRQADRIEELQQRMAELESHWMRQK